MKQLPQSHPRLDGTLYPSDTKTFHRVPIEVHQDSTLLRICFAYSPREERDIATGKRIALNKLKEYRELLGRLGPEVQLELDRRQEAIAVSVLPLRNLLNFSLYDPAGKFRGRWDSPQYFGEWVEIGPLDRTSRGFLPGPLPVGQWTVEIEVHAVVTDHCDYVLEYEVQGWDWYRGELHLHTNHSDAKVSLSEMVAAAKQHELDFIVLSDHNTVSSHGDIPKMDLPIIPGVELTTYYGHAVVMGVTEFVDWRADKDSNLKKQTDFVHTRGGLFSIAHPFVIGDPICTGCEWQYHNIDLNNVDLVEVWSGSWRKGWAHNNLALDWWNRLLNDGYRITGVAARDVHDPAQFSISDTADTYVWAEAPTPKALLQGLRNGRVWVSSGPRLVFAALVGGKQYGLGDSVEGGARIVLQAAVTNLNGPAMLRFIGNGSLIKELKIGGEECLSFNMDSMPPGQSWIRAELWQAHNGGPGSSTMLAFTNPIYFKA